jgi:hypothetical protein
MHRTLLRDAKYRRERHTGFRPWSVSLPRLACDDAAMEKKLGVCNLCEAICGL